jgi:hypothetical protein
MLILNGSYMRSLDISICCTCPSLLVQVGVGETVGVPGVVVAVGAGKVASVVALGLSRGVRLAGCVVGWGRNGLQLARSVNSISPAARMWWISRAA